MNISKIRKTKKSDRLEALLAELYGEDFSPGAVLDVEMALRKLQHLSFCTDRNRDGSVSVIIEQTDNMEKETKVVIENEDGKVEKIQSREWYNAHKFIEEYLGLGYKTHPADYSDMCRKFPGIRPSSPIYGMSMEKATTKLYDDIAARILSYIRCHFCNQVVTKMETIDFISATEISRSS